jgi:hypothetical protein
MRAIQEAPTVEALDAALDKMTNAGVSVTLWHSNAAIATAGSVCAWKCGFQTMCAARHFLCTLLQLSTVNLLTLS